MWCILLSKALYWEQRSLTPLESLQMGKSRTQPVVTSLCHLWGSNLSKWSPKLWGPGPGWPPCGTVLGGLLSIITVVSALVLIQTVQTWSSSNPWLGPLQSRRAGEEEGDHCVWVTPLYLVSCWLDFHTRCSASQWQHSGPARITSLALSLDFLTPRCEPWMARGNDQFLVFAQMAWRPLSLNQIPSQTLDSAAPASTVASQVSPNNCLCDRS